MTSLYVCIITLFNITCTQKYFIIIIIIKFYLNTLNGKETLTKVCTHS